MKIKQKDLLEAIEKKKALLIQLKEAEEKDEKDDEEEDKVEESEDEDDEDDKKKVDEAECSDDEDDEKKVDESDADDADEDGQDDKVTKIDEESDDEDEDDEDKKKVDESDADDADEDGQDDKVTKIDEESDDEDDEEEDKKKVDESLAAFRALTKKSIKLEGDLGGLLEAEGLTADFRKNATTIFESAVTSRLKSATKALEESYKKTLTESIQTMRKDLFEGYTQKLATLDEQVDAYVSHVASEWMEKNKIQLESALKVQAAENLIEGVRALFAENNITVPVGKENIIESLEDRCITLEAKCDKFANALVEAKNDNKKLVKEGAIVSFTKGMTEVKSAKIRELAESVEFVSEASFVEKLRVLGENFSSEKKKPSQEVLGEADASTTVGSNPIAAELSRLNKADWFV